MGKLVNVVRPDGKTVAIPEEDAQRLTASGYTKPETDQAATARVLEAKNEERASGFNQGVKAFAEGGLDALTGGGFGKIAGAISPDYAEDLANRGEHRPYVRAAGELASLATGTGLAGLARGAGELTIGATGSALAGRAVEGGIVGFGGHVATTNVTGDPLTIEGTMLSVGVGSFLNIGMGAAADKVSQLGEKAGVMKAETSVIQSDVATVKAGRDLFATNPNGWDSFEAATKSAVKTEQTAFKEAERATKAYNDFAGKKLRTEINKTENTINKISKYWREEGELDKLGASGRQPISDEMRSTLKGWRDRLRTVDQLRAGGYDTEATLKAGKWVKADVPADPVRAIEELRTLRKEMERFPKATRTSNWNDLPPPPPQGVAEPVAVKVPRSLHELAKMEPATIERLSNAVQKDPAASEAFNKLMSELGTNASDSVAGLHSKLGKYMDADKRLVAMARKEAEEEGNGLLGLIKRGAKKFVRYGSARAADSALGGGWLGAGARVFAGEGSAAAMNATEDLISGAMLQGKLGARQVVGALVSKMSGPTSKVLKELGPVSSYLQNRLFTNEPDKDDDDEGLALKRINETFAIASSAPDAAYIAAQEFLGHPSDAGIKLHQKAVGDINYLAQNAPKDPGIAMHGLKSEWKPSPDETQAFAYRIEAVVDPLKAIARTIAGDGHPAAIEALWSRWPALMQAAAEEFVYALHDSDKLTREAGENYSILFRTPITGSMTPEVMMTVQGIYLPKPEEGARPQVDSSGRPVGRPAAYDSQVAGSSVSGLLAQ